MGYPTSSPHPDNAVFQFLDLYLSNQILSVPSWYHPLFEIRFIRKLRVDFLQFWFQHITCDFLSSCIDVFIDNLQTRNDKYANSVRYVSQQRGRTRFPHLNHVDVHINSCLLGFREIGTHAFSPRTSWDGPHGHSYCCDFGSLLWKTIFKRSSSPSFSLKGRY